MFQDWPWKKHARESRKKQQISSFHLRLTLGVETRSPNISGIIKQLEVVLLMAEILHHLGCINNGITENYISTG